MTIPRRLRNTWRKNYPDLRALFRGGFPAFVVARSPGELRSNVPVFCYHVVEAEAFEADLDFLRSNDYTTIGAGDLLEHLIGRRRAPDRSVVLTFDDGPLNLFDVAFPLLQQYAMSGVAFIAPRFHQEESVDLNSAARSGQKCPCTWSQIHEMHIQGTIDFQSHTFEHRYIPRWPEPAELTGSSSAVIDGLRGPGLSMEEDFLLARTTIEKHLGKTVEHLAFPQYDGNETSVRIARDCGYTGFWCGTLPHRPDNRFGESAPFVVRISGEFVRRLPGINRTTLTDILSKRYLRALGRGRHRAFPRRE